MDKRTFTKIAGALGLAAALAPALALAAGPIKLRVSSAAADTDWLSGGLRVFKEQLEKLAPGKFAVEVYTGSSLFRQGTEVPALQRGNLEMSTMTTFEVEQQIPEFSVFSSGYLFRDYAHARKVFDSDIGKAYFAEVARKMELQIIEPMYLGTRQVNLRDGRAVKTPADLSGIKLRVPGGPGWVALGKGLGVTPTPMAVSEVYLALKTGAIDGQENPLPITKANNFQEVTKTIVLTSHLVQPVFLTMAKKKWDQIDAAGQQAVRQAARLAADYNDQGRIKEEAEIVDFFKSKGLTIQTPDLAAFRASVDKEYAQAGIAAKWPKGLKEKIEAVR